jgi:hypothetical protein
MRHTKLALALVALTLASGFAFSDSQENWATLYIEKIYCDHTTDVDDDDHLVIRVDGELVWERDHVNGGRTYAINYEKRFRKSAHVKVTELDFAYNDEVADFYADTGDRGGSYSIKSPKGHWVRLF